MNLLTLSIVFSTVILYLILYQLFIKFSTSKWLCCQKDMLQNQNKIVVMLALVNKLVHWIMVLCLEHLTFFTSCHFLLMPACFGMTFLTFNFLNICNNTIVFNDSQSFPDCSNTGVTKVFLACLFSACSFSVSYDFMGRSPCAVPFLEQLFL